MATRVETGALTSGGCMADRERLGAALVAALELALLAAHRLLGELDGAAGRHADATGHLERAQTLTAAGPPLDERVLALLHLAEPDAASGEPAAARAWANERYAGPVPLNSRPARDRTEGRGCLAPRARAHRHAPAG